MPSDEAGGQEVPLDLERRFTVGGAPIVSFI